MIDKFSDQYAFLANSHIFEGGVEYEGVRYPTVENAFQAAKTLDLELREPFVTYTPNIANRMGKKMELRPDWDYARVQVMQNLVKQKFNQETLKALLLLTADDPLTEYNRRHDNYWGMCMCPRCDGKKGLNWLGRILMTVRRELVANAATAAAAPAAVAAVDLEPEEEAASSTVEDEAEEA